MADPPNIHRASPAVSVTPNDTWQCRCSTLNSGTRKRCSTCMGWRHGSRKNGGQASVVSEEGVGAAAALSARDTIQRRVRAEADDRPVGSWRVLTLKNDNDAGGDEEMTHDPGSKKIYHRTSLNKVASQGCQKYKNEHETGKGNAHGHDDQCPRSRGTHGRSTHDKEVKNHNETRPYNHHRVSLEDAASLGCRKCKLEYETGMKTAKRHDANCPRSRGPKMIGKLDHHDDANDSNSVILETAHSLQCKKCTDEIETGMKTMGRYSGVCSRSKSFRGGEESARGLSSTCIAATTSHPSNNSSIDDGDPPWRTIGNVWIGRRVLYRPKDKTNDTRTCSKSRFYDEDIIDIQKPSSSYSSSAKGTIRGFISERDRDSKGNPGFISSRDGRPAKLFHIVFDKGNSCFLLNKDFEEWEIKEQCEWIDDESDNTKDAEDVDNNEKDTRYKNSDVAKVTFGDKALHIVSTANNSSTNATNATTRKVTFSQDSDENIDENTAPAFAPGLLNMKNSKDINVDGTMQEERVTESRIDRPTKNSLDLNLAECSSFNEALKSALSTYAATSALRGVHNPPPPMPPPFLSHQEESTLRTALAFVMIKARMKNKDTLNTSGTRRLGETGVTRHFASARQMSLGHSSLGWMSSVARRTGNEDKSRERDVKKSSYLGGLLSLPQGRFGEGKHSGSTANVPLALDRELDHIRAVLKLALSSILPLYRGALEINDKMPRDDGGSTVESATVRSDLTPKHSQRRPSAVYDFEAGYNPLFAGNASRKGMAERHYASLDGLCQHAISRLGRLMKYTTRKSKIEQMAKIAQVSKTHSDEQEKPAGGDLEPHQFDCRDSVQTKLIIRDAIVKLFYEDVIGISYHCMDGFQRHIVMNRIEKIMSACHVLHRMLFLDQSCCFATELVVAIARSLADLYSNNYSGVCSDCVDEDTKTIHDTSVENKAVQQVRKDRVQVVGPKWLPDSRTSHTNDRNERRIRSIDAMFCDTTSFSGGTKRKNQEQDEPESSDRNVPSLADVLAVNLLRLLECASAIRLHHRREKISCDQVEHRDYMASKAQSTTATEILTEIRSTNAVDLTLPIFIEDADAFFRRESIALRSDIHRNKTSHLRPLAKLMLRVHFFGLIKRLSSHEQV